MAAKSLKNAQKDKCRDCQLDIWWFANTIINEPTYHPENAPHDRMHWSGWASAPPKDWDTFTVVRHCPLTEEQLAEKAEREARGLSWYHYGKEHTPVSICWERLNSGKRCMNVVVDEELGLCGTHAKPIREQREAREKATAENALREYVIHEMTIIADRLKNEFGLDCEANVASKRVRDPNNPNLYSGTYTYVGELTVRNPEQLYNLIWDKVHFKVPFEITGDEGEDPF